MLKYGSTPMLVVYTVITNNYETLMPPSVVDPRIKYICFTDQPLWMSHVYGTVWEIKKIPKSRLDPTRKSRQVKILPHLFIKQFNCGLSIYMDGNVDIVGDLFELLAAYTDFKLLGFKHPFRDCTYEELDACMKLKKDDPETMKKQLERYRKEGFPEHYGLMEANVVVRKHNDPEVIGLMDSWWHEVKTGSKRDQLSLSYVMWRKNFQAHTMGEDNARENSRFFRVRRGWRTTPEPKWKVLVNKHIRWRFGFRQAIEIYKGFKIKRNRCL